MSSFGDKVSFIWSVTDLLRGPYRPNQYKDVMLPMTVLRRLDCVLEPTKDKVLARLESLEGGKVKDIDHFTPREVIRLMVNLLFLPDSGILTAKGIVKTLFDPACGTGGMLSVAEEYVRELNPDARLEVA